MGLKKHDLYSFIFKKKNSVKSEKLEPIRREIAEKKKAHIKNILKEKGYYDLDKDKISEIKKVTSDLRDAYDYSSSFVIRIYDYLGYFMDENKMITDLMNQINFSLVDDIFELQTKANKMQKDIDEEFEKIEKVLKAKSNAKQGYNFLKELGFDLSKLVIEEKMEIVNININNNLLGLPETNKEGFGSNEEA